MRCARGFVQRFPRSQRGERGGEGSRFITSPPPPIHAGLLDLKKLRSEPVRKTRQGTRNRTEGAGRKPLASNDDTRLRDLDALVEPTTRGDPMAALRWACKSTYQLAEDLKEKGHQVGQRTVCDLLAPLGYSLQATRKTCEGAQPADRNAQFAHIAKTVALYHASGQPVISVDTKNKALIGEFKNAGRAWQPTGSPEPVRVYEFIHPELGKLAPCGVYHLSTHTGWVSVGIDHDTAEFALHSIRQWWYEMGASSYPRAAHLIITADGGGSNGHRVHLWRMALQKLTDALGLPIELSHFPPSTRKWNKMERRMFCHIIQNWRGRPLVSREGVVNLIANTTTRQG